MANVPDKYDNNGLPSPRVWVAFEAVTSDMLAGSVVHKFFGETPERREELRAELVAVVRERIARIRGNRGAVPVTWSDLALIWAATLEECVRFMHGEGEPWDR